MLADYDYLRQLPIAEMLRIIGALWDDIMSSDEEFPLAEWDRIEAERRDAEMEADPSIGLTREELWQRVDRTRD